VTPIRKVIFLGSKPLGLECLRTLWALAPDVLQGVLTLDDRSDARSVFSVIEEFCASHQIPFWVARNRKHSEEIIRQQEPELCFVSGWYWLLTRQILDTVPSGFIGIHFSLLPKYRGGSPLVWAMINGEPAVGLSMFSFTEGVDAGPLWAQRSITVGPDEYIDSVLARLEAQSVDLLHSSYLGILNRTIQAAEQNPLGASYCSMRNPADGLIDWKAPAAQVHNFVRAQSHPYPGAFTWHQQENGQEEKLIFWKARLCPHPYYGTPGQVAQISSGEVYIVCGDHRAIIAESVEWKGNTSPAGEVLKSVTIRFAAQPPACPERRM
jgi:methionyl-tRNA formyltransferase